MNPPAGGHRWKFPVLIVDDLGVLLSLGVRLVDLLNFVHYCRVTVNAELKVTLDPSCGGLFRYSGSWTKGTDDHFFPHIQLLLPPRGSCDRNS